VLAYVVFQPPQQWVLLLIVGLGVALSATIHRLRTGHREARGASSRAWQLAERLGSALEDRIRYGDPDESVPYLSSPHIPYGQVPPGQAVYGQGYAPAVAYDPGALLSGIVAVLAAEGLPVTAGPALPAVAGLLADLGIQSRPGVPAPTAAGLVDTLPVGPPRRIRVMSAGLLASVVRVVLTRDRVLPEQISTDVANTLIDYSAAVLMALGVQPADNGSLADWPLIAQIIDAAPLPVPYEQRGW
jgi:hypothetical protein